MISYISFCVSFFILHSSFFILVFLELESVKAVKSQLKNKLKDYKQRLENVSSLEEKRSEVKIKKKKYPESRLESNQNYKKTV